MLAVAHFSRIPDLGITINAHLIFKITGDFQNALGRSTGVAKMVGHFQILTIRTLAGYNVVADETGFTGSLSTSQYRNLDSPDLSPT